MLKSNAAITGNWRGLLVIWLVATAAIAFMPRVAGELVVNVESAVPANVQLYYDRGAGLSEQDSVIRAAPPGRSTLSFPLSSGSYRSFRLDPTTGSTPVVLSDMKVRLPNGTWEPFDVGSATPANIARVEKQGSAWLVVPTEGANDAQLLFVRNLVVDARMDWTGSAFIAGLIVLCLALLLQIAATRNVSTRGLVSALILVAVVLGLALALGLGARINDHPDEFSHVAALRFYVENGFLPPAVSDPRLVPSISVWGYSYLFETDVVYPLTAALLKLTGHAAEPLVPDARLCNVALLLVLALGSLQSRAFALAAATTLLSPQVWYVYSYYNADALPLTMALLLAGLAADEDGAPARFVRGEPYRRLDVIVFVLVTAVLLCSKRNYLVIFPMVGMWLAARHAGLRLPEVLLGIAALMLLGYATFASTPLIGFPTGEGTWAKWTAFACIAVVAVLWLLRLGRETQWRKPFLRLMVLGVLCVTCALPRHAWDYWQNGSPTAKAAKIGEIAERLAGQGFKPSDSTSEQRYAQVAPRRNGVSLWQTFSDLGWARFSLHSAYGYYGYMTISTPVRLAYGLAWLTAAFVLVGVIALRRMLPAQWTAPAFVMAGGAVLVAWSSLLHSWINAFQPQGRYLLPAFALFAMPVVAARAHLPRLAFRGIVLVAAILSAYSFLFYALAGFFKAAAK